MKNNRLGRVQPIRIESPNSFVENSINEFCDKLVYDGTENKITFEGKLCR